MPNKRIQKKQLKQQIIDRLTFLCFPDEIKTSEEKRLMRFVHKMPLPKVVHIGEEIVENIKRERQLAMARMLSFMPSKPPQLPSDLFTWKSTISDIRER